MKTLVKEQRDCIREKVEVGRRDGRETKKGKGYSLPGRQKREKKRKKRGRKKVLREDLGQKKSRLAELNITWRPAKVRGRTRKRWHESAHKK